MTFRVHCPLSREFVPDLCVPGAWVNVEVFRDGVPITQESTIRQARTYPQQNMAGNKKTQNVDEETLAGRDSLQGAVHDQAHHHTTAPFTTTKIDHSLRYLNSDTKSAGVDLHDNYTVEVCTMIRNEEPKIVEWVEYHLMIGVSVVHVYLHLSGDRVAEALQPYVRDGESVFVFMCDCVCAHLW